MNEMNTGERVTLVCIAVVMMAAHYSLSLTGSPEAALTALTSWVWRQVLYIGLSGFITGLAFCYLKILIWTYDENKSIFDWVKSSNKELKALQKTVDYQTTSINRSSQKLSRLTKVLSDIEEKLQDSEPLKEAQKESEIDAAADKITSEFMQS